ncbi:MAG: hypothetical protein IJQ34_08315 [Kiritimatiellae bacterium]|nr:hypothetical protein [Kiritimatiellia bacterium]
MTTLKKVAAKFKPNPVLRGDKSPSIPRPPTLAPAKSPKARPIDEEAASFVSMNKRKTAITKPYSDGEYAYATDGASCAKAKLLKAQILRLSTRRSRYLKKRSRKKQRIRLLSQSRSFIRSSFRLL